MIYLKNLNNQVKEFKDSDTGTVDAMMDSGRWARVSGRKDFTPYTEPKAAKTTKKSKKK